MNHSEAVLYVGAEVKAFVFLIFGWSLTPWFSQIQKICRTQICSIEGSCAGVQRGVTALAFATYGATGSVKNLLNAARKLRFIWREFAWIIVVNFKNEQGQNEGVLLGEVQVDVL